MRVMAQSGWGRPRDDDHMQLAAWLIAEQVWIQHHLVPQWATDLETRLNRKLKTIMATLTEALDGWRAYVADLKAQLATAVGGLTDAQAAAQAAADALAAFQADDAATDASQLAAQAQADADAVAAALAEVQAPVEPPPVIDEPVQ